MHTAHSITLHMLGMGGCRGYGQNVVVKMLLCCGHCGGDPNGGAVGFFWDTYVVSLWASGFQSSVYSFEASI